MILCPHCKPRRRRSAWDDTPRSRVVETREVLHRVMYRGERCSTLTYTRTRECLGCRYRWRTIETVSQMPVARKKRPVRAKNSS